jgi:hypothetical protein
VDVVLTRDAHLCLHPVSTIIDLQAMLVPKR